MQSVIIIQKPWLKTTRKTYDDRLYLSTQFVYFSVTIIYYSYYTVKIAIAKRDITQEIIITFWKCIMR